VGARSRFAETEFKLAPKDATAKAGKVTVTAKNDGQNRPQPGGRGQRRGEEDRRPAAGSSGKLALNLKPGKYEMYCAIDGHRASGMEGTITVS
jgi:uncharacterized cupredoxin-like copper-binding protein